MLIEKNCPKCGKELYFEVDTYNDCGGICYDIEVPETVENSLIDKDREYFCKHCGKEIMIGCDMDFSVS